MDTEVISIPPIMDIHSHILPGLDDGSRDMEETRALLREAYHNGIRKIIATPHYIHGHIRADSEEIRKSVMRVQEAASEISPELYILSGHEIFYFGGILEALERGRALTLADTRYVLIEFSPAISYGEIFKAVHELIQARYYPVLAHIERYKCLRQHRNVDELIHMGALMQMNYRSIGGLRHFSDRVWCRRMVLGGKIHFMGTDMHRINYRAPDIGEETKWLKRKGGQEFYRRLVWENPLILLSGEPLS